MKRLTLLGFSLVLGFGVSAQTYAPVSVTGYTADVVANGNGSAAASTTLDVDGGSFAFVATNFVNPSGQSPSSALPNNGTITSAVAATPGLTFQLAPYTSNNSLRISGTGAGALTFSAPTSADQVFVLATSGSGVSAVTITVTFTDGTNQVFNQSVSDWFNGSNFAIQGISRVNRSSNAIENSSTNPRLYQYQLVLSPANIGKPIQSINFAKTSTAGVLNVMGVSVRLVASPVNNDVGITAISAPESGCGLTAQETVTVTIQNFGLNAQSNIPVYYSLNGGTPVNAVFQGPLASNVSATYSFAATADLSALGTYNLVAGTNLNTDTVANNNTKTKDVVVSQTPVTPTITVTGPTTFCSGNYVTLSAGTSTVGASFQWLRNGTPITGGTTENYAASTSGSYSVIAYSNGCSSDTSANTVLTSNAAPTAPTVSPNGTQTLCSGDSITLTAYSATQGATYRWLRNGTTIQGATGNTFVATTSGSYSAMATAGGCTSMASGGTTVNVMATPVTPTITQSGMVLSSSSGIGNQWYKDGVAIIGAESNTYTVTATGTYTTVITDNGCSSQPSNALTVVVTGLEQELAGTNLVIYPNPNTGKFTVTFNGPQASELIVTDLAGKIVWTQPVAGTQNQVHMAAVASGTYILLIKSAKGVVARKLVVQ